MPSFVAGGRLRRVEWPCGMASLLPRLISSLVLSLVLPKGNPRKTMQARGLFIMPEDEVIVLLKDIVARLERMEGRQNEIEERQKVILMETASHSSGSFASRREAP
jgi:hypothetical protein